MQLLRTKYCEEKVCAQGVDQDPWNKNTVPVKVNISLLHLMKGNDEWYMRRYEVTSLLLTYMYSALWYLYSVRLYATS